MHKPLPDETRNTNLLDQLQKHLLELNDCAHGLRVYLTTHGDADDMAFAAACGIDALVRDVLDCFQALPRDRVKDAPDQAAISKAASILRHIDNRLSELNADDADHYQIDQAIKLIEGRALKVA